MLPRFHGEFHFDYPVIFCDYDRESLPAVLAGGGRPTSNQ